MATRSFVPNQNNEGSLGTSDLKWKSVYSYYADIKELSVNNIRSTNGTLLTYTDKSKIDNMEKIIEEYVAPVATYNSTGTVQIGDNLTLKNGVLSVSKHNIVTALGYTPPTAEEVNEKILTQITKSLNEDKMNSIRETLDYISNNGNGIINIATDVENLKQQKQDANTAVTHKQDIAVGSNVKGVFINEHGEAVITKYAVNKEVPSNAIFTDTTYEPVTVNLDGLMRAEDKAKLDDIDARANFYTLPTSTATILGGVKIGNNISVNNGVISINNGNVIEALGYTPARDKAEEESNILDTLESNSTDKALSANQGRILNETINSKANKSHTHHDYYYTKDQIDERFSTIPLVIKQDGYSSIIIDSKQDEDGVDYYFVSRGITMEFETPYVAPPTICDGIEDIFEVTSTTITPKIGAKVTSYHEIGGQSVPWKVIGFV